MESKPHTILPESIATKQDFMHTYRELLALVDLKTQDTIRGKSSKTINVSVKLKSLAEKNNIKLQDLDECKKLLKNLEVIKNNAPSVHLSFAAEPNDEILQKLIRWFRRNTGSNVLIQVGLQPSIAAGAMLRTPNKSFDFSLRTELDRNRDKLIEVLKDAK